MARKKKAAAAPKEPVNPLNKKLYTPSQTAQIFQVDPRTVGRWAKGEKDSTGSVSEPPRLDFVTTPGGTRRITRDSLISSGVCRNCSTLRSFNGKCECSE